MSDGVIQKMNRGLGIGLALGVKDNQRFEYLRESHREEAAAESEAREIEEAGAGPVAMVPRTHMFRGEELPGPPLELKAATDEAPDRDGSR
jgi:hypothetical protein